MNQRLTEIESILSSLNFISKDLISREIEPKDSELWQWLFRINNLELAQEISLDNELIYLYRKNIKPVSKKGKKKIVQDNSWSVILTWVINDEVNLAFINKDKLKFGTIKEAEEILTNPEYDVYSGIYFPPTLSYIYNSLDKYKITTQNYEYLNRILLILREVSELKFKEVFKFLTEEGILLRKIYNYLTERSLYSNFDGQKSLASNINIGLFDFLNWLHPLGSILNSITYDEEYINEVEEKENIFNMSGLYLVKLYYQDEINSLNKIELILLNYNPTKIVIINTHPELNNINILNAKIENFQKLWFNILKSESSTYFSLLLTNDSKLINELPGKLKKIELFRYRLWLPLIENFQIRVNELSELMEILREYKSGDKFILEEDADKVKSFFK